MQIDNELCVSCHIEHEASQLLHIQGGPYCRECHAQRSNRDKSTRIARKSQQAAQSAAIARRYEIWGDAEDAATFHEHAAVTVAEARKLQQRPALPAVVMGEVATGQQNYIKDTLENPDIAALDASAERTRLLLLGGNDCAALGLDASNSIRAENSLEKMLTHQLAATHKASMEMLSRAMYDLDATRRIKMMNAAMRGMETFQKGLLTLQRLRTNGQQHIVVQHVQVADGGQAVIAGAVSRGGDQK